MSVRDARLPRAVDERRMPRDLSQGVERRQLGRFMGTHAKHRTRARKRRRVRVPLIRRAQSTGADQRDGGADAHTRRRSMHEELLHAQRHILSFLMKKIFLVEMKYALLKYLM